jgi:hypothetical protein
MLLSLMVWVGCGPAPEPEGAVEQEQPLTDVGAAETESLPHPFSADEIRDEWMVGFRLKLRRVMQGTESVERWTVVSADPDVVEIESAALDGDGNVLGQASLARSTWVELRDHATFPAARAEREEATRDTELGTLDGWVYTVQEDDDGTVSEFFFAKDLPGAPVEMRTTRGDELMMELVQLERHRPDQP